MLTPRDKRRIVDATWCQYCGAPAGRWCVRGMAEAAPPAPQRDWARKVRRLHGARISAAVRLGLITRNVQVAEMRRRGH